MSEPPPMLWFGDARAIPYPWCTEKNHHTAAITAPCTHCDEAVTGADSGLLLPSCEGFRPSEITYAPVHAECWARMMFGSATHQLIHRLAGQEGAQCSPLCFDPVPPLSKRAAARLAWETWRNINRPRVPS